MSPLVKLLPNQSLPKLCYNCKYFSPAKSMINNIDKNQYGRCTYFRNIDVVTGEISYDLASVVREYTCKETLYEEKEVMETKKSWWKF